MNIELGVPGQITGRVQYARPYGGAVVASDGDDDRFWFELTYQF